MPHRSVIDDIMIARIILLLAVLAPAAMADQPVYSVWRTIMDPEHDRELLLRREVQQDLGLSASTIDTIVELHRSAVTSQSNLLKAVPQYRKDGNVVDYERHLAAMQQAFKLFETKSWELLDEFQRRRLYELTLQRHGAAMLTRPKTIKEFSLTEEQVAKAEKLLREAYRRRMDADAANHGGSPPAPGKEWDEVVKRSRAIGETLMKEINEIPEQVLTREQLRLWRELDAMYRR
jgi:hypothetical protein